MKKINGKKFWAAGAAVVTLGTGRIALAVDVQQGMDPLQAMSNLTAFILSIVSGIGVIGLIWGFVQLGLSFKSQDASQRTQSILFLAGGAVMFGVKYVLQAIGVQV
jgi:hypothetical protein